MVWSQWVSGAGCGIEGEFGRRFWIVALAFAIAVTLRCDNANDRRFELDMVPLSQVIGEQRWTRGRSAILSS